MHKECVNAIEKPKCPACHKGINKNYLRKLEVTVNPYDFITKCAEKIKEVKEVSESLETKIKHISEDKEKILIQWKKDALKFKEEANKVAKINEMIIASYEAQIVQMNRAFTQKAIEYKLLAEIYERDTNNEIPSYLKQSINDPPCYDTSNELLSIGIKTVLAQAYDEGLVDGIMDTNNYNPDTIKGKLHDAATSAKRKIEGKIELSNNKRTAMDIAKVPNMLQLAINDLDIVFSESELQAIGNAAQHLENINVEDIPLSEMEEADDAASVAGEHV